jgi:adenylate kinase family enzyme
VAVLFAWLRALRARPALTPHRAPAQAPRELVWLNGAPGSGKGTNTPFILRSRGLGRAVCVSSLLAAEQSAAINAGALVSDAAVVDALLAALLDPSRGAEAAGAVVDGFPRTPLQVDFLCLLHDKLVELHLRHADNPALSPRFPRPHFRVVVLFVDEAESVRRQLARGAHARTLHARALDAGVPHAAAAARATDASDAVARARYQVFRRHYATLLRLKERFPFTLVDACGSLADTEAQIATELRYQSSLELSERAYAAIRGVPLAVDLVRDARRQLVARLDAAAARQPATLADVVALAEEQVAPVLRRAALAGHATWRTDAALFELQPAAADMLVDVLSDRGYAVEYERTEARVPVRVDAATGAVICDTRVEHAFSVTFERALLRAEGRPAGGASATAAATLAVPSSDPSGAERWRRAAAGAAGAGAAQLDEEIMMLAAPAADAAARREGAPAQPAPARAALQQQPQAQAHDPHDVSEVLVQHN